jgi:hypothetical protein
LADRVDGRLHRNGGPGGFADAAVEFNRAIASAAPASNALSPTEHHDHLLTNARSGLPVWEALTRDVCALTPFIKPPAHRHDRTLT